MRLVVSTLWVFAERSDEDSNDNDNDDDDIDRHVDGERKLARR